MRDFETHRCEGSLKNYCSIRRYQVRRNISNRDGRWHLWRQVTDFDYDVTYMSEVAAINVCPWCGERLEG